MKPGVYTFNRNLYSLFFVLALICCNNKKADTHKSSFDFADISQNSKKTLPTNNASSVQEGKYEYVISIPVPDDFARVEVQENSFGEYLRNFPLKQTDNIVYLYNGEQKWPQDIHIAVLKIDVGNRDLQQCADAVMRLRGEYLYTRKKYDDIHFNFLSDGKPRYYKDHADSEFSYKSFRKYMDYIFSYANTASLLKELKSVQLNDMKIGDVFIQKGNPYGHAIIVIDVAKHKVSGKKIFMLAQSYMPAQEIHILKNLNDPGLSPWYNIDFGDELRTPEWNFRKEDLKRF
ncbi:MAG: DUF4846 domain-containing protein [Bacteroidota bacterium]